MDEKGPFFGHSGPVSETELFSLPGEEESLFVVRDSENRAFVRANLHCHSTDCDGAASQRELLALSEEKGVNFAISGHNLPPAKVGIPASEITVREGVDIVIFGETREKMHQIFDDVIRQKLVGRNFRFNPTRLWAEELLEAVHGENLQNNFVHYGTIEGLSTLPLEKQEKILQKHKHHSFLELNALLPQSLNELSALLADEWGIPIITTGDTHQDAHQYTGTYVEIPLDALTTQSNGSLMSRLVRALRTHSHRNVLRYTTITEKIRTGIQAVRSSGFIPTMRYGMRFAKRFVGLLPKAHKAFLPKFSKNRVSKSAIFLQG